MKKFYFHIFLVILALIILMPIIWMVLASAVKSTQIPFMFERIFKPESFNYNVEGNTLSTVYKLEGMSSNITFKFDAPELADQFIIVRLQPNMQTYQEELMYEAVAADPALEQTEKKQWVMYFKLDANKNIVRESIKVNNASILNFMNILTFDNYKDIFRDRGFRNWLANSVIISLLTGLISVFLGFFAGYSFSRWRFPGRKVGLIWVLTTQLFPLAMMLVPFYILATNVFPEVIPGLKLTNSIFGLIIIYSATALPFAIWMLKGYFDTVPVDLEEAAAIDGASLFQLLFLILFPLTRPAIFTAFLFSFVQAWNEYAIANLFLTLADKYTLPVGLRTLLDNNNMAGFATAAVVASVPVVILFLSMKKELVEGATLGAVKG
ncbi:MAG: ABC transporter permease subunit [Brevinematales bacterium]|nr:ABC transporter permease subunit [Brevinematales bacterium]